MTKTKTFWEHLLRAILETCDIWDTDYNSDNWEPEFMTIFVIWQLIVTLDSIRNSCDVLQGDHERLWLLIYLWQTEKMRKMIKVNDFHVSLKSGGKNQKIFPNCLTAPAQLQPAWTDPLDISRKPPISSDIYKWHLETLRYLSWHIKTTPNTNKRPKIYSNVWGSLWGDLRSQPWQAGDRLEPSSHFGKKIEGNIFSTRLQWDMEILNPPYVRLLKMIELGQFPI